MESTDITEFISILRKPKIKIIDKNIALFDVSAYNDIGTRYRYG